MNYLALTEWSIRGPDAAFNFVVCYRGCLLFLAIFKLQQKLNWNGLRFRARIAVEVL
jgi:hypothetical protein